MTFAMPLPRPNRLVTAALAAALVVILLLGLASIASTQPASMVVTDTSTTEAASASVAPATIEEPWVPGVMTFSGERPTRTTPPVLEDLDPNCACIGSY